MRIVEIISQPVTPQRLAQTIKEVSASYIKDGLAPTLYQVNNGHCESLAIDVTTQLGGETDTLFTVDALNFCVNSEGDESYWDAALLKKHWPKCHPTHGLTWRDIKYEVPSHVWIVFEHRHYDAEAPQGVDNFFELPLLRRGMERIARRKSSQSARRRR